MDLNDIIFENMNNGLVTSAVFIDLRKTFDTVDHTNVLKKINNIGIKGDLFDWCIDYLSNREQKTLVNGKKSNYQKVKCRVPQGSVLGPLFFIIYVNDMISRVGKDNVKLYADDTVIFAESNNQLDLQYKVQNLLDIFTKWSKENKLSINVDKTIGMLWY